MKVTLFRELLSCVTPNPAPTGWLDGTTLNSALKGTLGSGGLQSLLSENSREQAMGSECS